MKYIVLKIEGRQPIWAVQVEAASSDECMQKIAAMFRQGEFVIAKVEEHVKDGKIATKEIALPHYDVLSPEESIELDKKMEEMEIEEEEIYEKTDVVDELGIFLSKHRNGKYTIAYGKEGELQSHGIFDEKEDVIEEVEMLIRKEMK